MPVSGLVVTLKDPGDAVDHSLQQLRQHPQIQLGPAAGNRLPLVVDTPDREADKRCWRWLELLPGVHHVDVAFIHFEESDAGCGSSSALIAHPTIGES